MDKFNIELLYYLFINGKCNEMDSCEVKEIMNNTNLNSCYNTYVRRIRLLVGEEFISEGYQNGNAKTYFISKKGIEFLKTNIINKEELVTEMISVDLDEGDI